MAESLANEQRNSEIDRGEGGLTQNGQCLGRDRRLQIARRVDWRFLLPSPQLDQIVYVGPEDVTLLEALKQFSASLKVMTPPYKMMAEQNYSDCSLAVLHSANPDDLEGVNMVLDTDGLLYWEISRTSLKGRMRLRHFRDYFGALERWGLSAMQVCWHRPNFEACLEIIPLDHPAALMHVFSRRPDDMPGKAKLVLARGLSHLGLLPRLVPCLSIIARKGAEPVGSA